MANGADDRDDDATDAKDPFWPMLKAVVAGNMIWSVMQKMDGPIFNALGWTAVVVLFVVGIAKDRREARRRAKAGLDSQ